MDRHTDESGAVQSVCDCGQFGMTAKAELMLDFPRGEGRKENGAGSSDLNPGPPQVGSESITQLPRWHQFLNELKGL